jgi:hypothetical protein
MTRKTVKIKIQKGFEEWWQMYEDTWPPNGGRSLKASLYSAWCAGAEAHAAEGAKWKIPPGLENHLIREMLESCESRLLELQYVTTVLEAKVRHLENEAKKK